MCDGQPSRPANILEIVAINQGRSPLTTGEPSASGMDVDGFADAIEDGHAVVDVRSTAAFGAGHISGAYNIQVAAAEFEQRVGWVVPLEAPILLVLDDDAAIEAALHKLAFVGLDQRVKGFLSGGMDAWAAADKPQATLPQMGVRELHDLLQGGNGIRVLDVREADEWDEGHVEGAVSMSFKVLEEHLGDLDDLDIGPGDRVAVMCAGGVRSSTACSILQRRGYTDVHNTTGGMGAWKDAELPTVVDAE